VIIIEEILISDEILEKKFHCNLNACKGACCVEGDFGAPLEQEEVETIKEIYPKIKHLLSSEAIERIKTVGISQKFKKDKTFEGTVLLNDGKCVFVNKDELGIMRCMIEKANFDGLIDFRKPISCHLYPIRVAKNEEIGLSTVNYDEWDICSAACSLGEEKKLPLYQFVKDALIRKFGQDFYDKLDGYYQQQGAPK